MEQGHWIEMTGVLLITAEGAATEGVATDDAEGRGAETGRSSDHRAEGLTEQGAEAVHDDIMGRATPTERDPAHEMVVSLAAEHAMLAVIIPLKPLLWTLKMSLTHWLRRRPRLPTGQVEAMLTTWRTRPSLKTRCSPSAPQHVKLTPKVQAMPRLSPHHPPLPKLRSEGSRTRV
jgi:hypothetical protein